MARFKITWDTGLVTECEQSDCKTVEQFINCRFGAGAEVTARVELVVDEAPVEPVEVEPPAEPVKAQELTKAQEPTKAAEPSKAPAARPKAPVKAG